MPSARRAATVHIRPYTGRAMRGRGLLRRPILGIAILAVAAAAPTASAASRAWTLHLGGTFSASGHSGGGRTGTVTVKGRWGASGPYELVTSTKTDSAGRYSFSVTPNRRGVLTLQIVPPDHHLQRLVLRVL